MTYLQCFGDIKNLPAEIVERIKSKIRDIEKQRNISVIHSCIVGSHSLGIHNESSDYDIRLIYIDRPEWYFRVNKNNGYDDLFPELNDYYFKECSGDLNIIGYGLYETFEMITKSSHIPIELLRSKLVLTTCNTPMAGIRKFCEGIYTPDKCFSRYKRLAKIIYREIKCDLINSGNGALTPKIINNINLFIYYILSGNNYDALFSISVNLEQLVNGANIPGEIKETIHSYFNFIESYQGIGNMEHVNGLVESLYELNEIPYIGDMSPTRVDAESIAKFHMDLVINHFKE